MGNVGERPTNPLAAIPRGAAIDLVLENVGLFIEDGEWKSNAHLEVAVSGDTWTITRGEYACQSPCGKIPPCSIRSIVANRSRFAMLGPVVRLAEDMHVDATQSTVKLRLNDEDKCQRIQCILRDMSEFGLNGAVAKLTIDADASMAVLYVRCDAMRIRAVSSSITGTQVTDIAFLEMSDASKLKKLHVRRHADLGGTGATMDVCVDPACTIENPPKWIPLATALARVLAEKE